jgi:hypothetical protein
MLFLELDSVLNNTGCISIDCNKTEVPTVQPSSISQLSTDKSNGITEYEIGLF